MRKPESQPLGKEYIGDGVYADQEEYGLVLTTENGISVTNRIVIDVYDLDALESYIRRFRGLFA